MNFTSVNLELLFDADEYWRSGQCPWTFFAYPSILAADHGLPPDTDACRLLAELQARGIAVAIWIDALANNTTYFACRHEDIHRVTDALEELQRSGSFPENFCSERSEQLFKMLEDKSMKPTMLLPCEKCSRSRCGTAVFFSEDPDPYWPAYRQIVRIMTPNGDTFLAKANVEFARKVPPGEVMGLLFPTLSPDQIPVRSKVARIDQTQQHDGT